MRRTLFQHLTVILLLAGCTATPTPHATTPEPATTLPLTPVPFVALPNWQADDPSQALAQFKTVCKRFSRKLATAAASKTWPELGSNGDWAKACNTARATKFTPANAKPFIEATFQAYRVGAPGQTGLFTGYYEPEVLGARRRGGPYQFPLYRKPKDILAADLGAFSDTLKGKTILGRVANGRFIPYFERADIAKGALKGRKLELVWLDSRVAGFFLEIQGSGVIKLPDGLRMRVGYAGKNGRPYRAIGRDLIEQGAIQRKDMSMQAIRSWLADNPNDAARVMNLNRSAVFFREVKGRTGPVGAAGTTLAAGRSLAVDPKFAPLGALVYLDVPHPDAGPGQNARPLQRLVVAEDTGGAIKGPIRGDLFWGTGPAAGDKAGRMATQGLYYILAPRRR